MRLSGLSFNVNCWQCWVTHLTHSGCDVGFMLILKSGSGSGSGRIWIRPNLENWNPVHPYLLCATTNYCWSNCGDAIWSTLQVFKNSLLKAINYLTGVIIGLRVHIGPLYWITVYHKVESDFWLWPYCWKIVCSDVRLWKIAVHMLSVCICNVAKRFTCTMAGFGSGLYFDLSALRPVNINFCSRCSNGIDFLTGFSLCVGLIGF